MKMTAFYPQLSNVLSHIQSSVSVHDTFSFSFSTGTPVLARDIPGIASLVTHGVTGLVYSCPATFLEGLHSLLHHPHLKTSLVMAARDRVTRHHSPGREQDALLRILRRVVLEQDLQCLMSSIAE